MTFSSKTNQLLILYALSSLVVIGAYVFLTLHINSKKVSASAALSEIELLENQNNQLKDLGGILKDINEDQDKLDSFFVHSDEIVSFLESVEAIGRDSGAEVEVRSLSEEETNNSSINILTLNITAKGDWESVYHFLVLIQNFPVISTFDRIHMSGIEKTTLDEYGDEISAKTEWSGIINMKVLELKKKS